MNVVSGEILYHINDISDRGRKIFSNIDNDLWNYLDNNNNNDNKEKYDKIRISLINNYKLNINNKIILIRNEIESIKNNIKLILVIENNKINNDLIKEKELLETKIMKLVLQYYTLLKDELKISRIMLLNDIKEKNISNKQIKIIRDIRMFNNHLIIESNKKILFTMLTKDTEQYNRCIKAVKDNININRSLYSNVPNIKEKISILNILKLHNLFLSNKLQNASEKVTNGKVKGLFCCLSIEQFYNFSVFGLFSQILPGKTPVDLTKLSEDIFSTPWFHIHPPDNIEITNELQQLLKISGTAYKLSTHRSNSNNNSNIIKFSRYSTLSNISNYSEEQLNNGIFLSLCRVLIIKQKNIAKDIEDIDIIEAIRDKYDCIYSSLREEYVLLNPKYVLPEFFMHTRLPHPTNIFKNIMDTNITNNNNDDNMSNMLKLPDSITATNGSNNNRTYNSLENMMMENAVINNMKVSFLSPSSLNDSIQNSDQDDSRTTIIKKRNIVNNMNEIFENFSNIKNQLVLNTIKNISKNIIK